MKKYKYPKLFSGKWLHYGLLLVAGVFLGWIFFHSSGSQTEKHEHLTEAAQGTVWTCSMHPHIRMEQPGKCPICGMDLIPLVQGGSSSYDPDAIHLTREAAALANVLTTKVSKQNSVKEVRLYGKVQADERLFQSQVSHVPGRIEKLFVNFTGEQIRSGQKLAEIYSPELVTAQQELLETVKTKQLQPELYEASKEKLRQWKLTDNQIASIENSGRIIDNFEVLSNTSGTVISRRVSAGDYVSSGSVLFEIADLSNVWVLFDAYETDLPFLNKGDRVKFSIQAMPGSELSGNIVFIDPILDPVTRVAKVRVEAKNLSGKLKPEMFATGIVSSGLKEYKDNIIIPKSAVLWTGKRSLVYVKDTNTDEPVFRLREIGLGPVLSEGYIVTDGLAEGEEIVTQGTFSVDAASQLEGKPSMMNPQGGDKVSSMPGMTMPDDSKSGENTDMSEIDMSENTSHTGQKTSVDMDFIMQLNNLLDQYLNLKNYLVQDNSKMAIQAAGNFQKALSGVDMKHLSGDNHLKWMDLSGGIAESLTSIINSDGLEQERKTFQSLSKDLYDAIKTFGVMNRTVYYQFCPMYDNNKGGYWLSETEEILNPYFGKEMLSCGEIRETLKY
ncbi:MAG TPA: efflux RND transporter periplasmic adaptor subunit [Bacteroidales bacterium]|nr:efflux RND transporter periplasmic adaptor subunit [Bacteroidales bacterium]